MRTFGKILLSGGLICGSAAYALWQHAPAPLPASVAVREPAELPVVSPPPVTPAPLAPPLATAEAPVPGPETPQTKTEAAERAPAVAAAPAPPSATPPSEPLQAASAGRYEDGEFTGIAADGEWGPVRVKVVVRGGDIADVVCVEYPNHRERSAEISEWAIPRLVEETLKAQSEKIDWVTQASFTSENFQQSLASALLRAQKSPAS